MSNTKDNKVLVSFSAIDPWLERNIVSPAETPVHGKDYVQWGDNNSYPDYLLELVKTVPTLRSIIQGTVDFIVGDDATILPLVEGYAPGVMNKLHPEHILHRRGQLYRQCAGIADVAPAGHSCAACQHMQRVTAPIGTIDLLRIAHDIFRLCTPVTVREFHSVSSLRDSEIIIAQRRVCNKLPPRINITPT